MKILSKLKAKLKKYINKIYKDTINDILVGPCFGGEDLTEEDIKALYKQIEEIEQKNEKGEKH